MLHLESLDLITRLMRAIDRLMMNVFGPADRTDADAPIIHRNDDEEAASNDQLAAIDVERDDEGHSWAFRKKHLED